MEAMRVREVTEIMVPIIVWGRENAQRIRK